VFPLAKVAFEPHAVITDVEQARQILTVAAHQLLAELQDLPEKVTDPNWLKELEADDHK
jgi:hypothetical protein